MIGRLQIRVEFILSENRLNLTDDSRTIVDTLFKDSKLVKVVLIEFFYSVDLSDDTGSILPYSYFLFEDSKAL